MKYSKSMLTNYAKELAKTCRDVVDVMCYSEEISKNQLSRDILDSDNQELILEVAKRYSKYVFDEMNVDLESGDVQELCNIINIVFSCCEENNWFR